MESNIPDDVIEVFAIAVRESKDHDLVSLLAKRHPALLSLPTGVGSWLHAAALDGDLPMVQLLVRLGMDVNTPLGITSDPPETALVCAVTSSSIKLVQWLLSQGAIAECTVNSEGMVKRNFALVRAVSQGNKELIQLLVDYGSNINIMYQGSFPYPRSPLDFTSDEDLIHYLRLLGAKTAEELCVSQVQVLPSASKTTKRNTKKS